MKLVSSMNEINYGSYDKGLDWNVQNYQIHANGKSLIGKKALSLLSCNLRINIFSQKSLQAEMEFLKNNNALRIMLIGYDTEHDIYLEKTWMLAPKQFSWEGGPEKYQISGGSLGLDFNITCSGSGSVHFHFSYFDHYQIHFVSHTHCDDHKPLRNVNPFDFDTWCFSEKHAMLECSSMDLKLDGNNYTSPSNKEPSAGAPQFNISYEWSGGYFPALTKELRCQFWQCGLQQHVPEESLGPLSASPSGSLAGTSAASLIPDKELHEFNLKEPIAPWHHSSKLPALAGSLLMMGHDSCSSESAIWIERKIRYRLPRIVPSFSRSKQNPKARGAKAKTSATPNALNKNGELLPDLEWEISAGSHLTLNFQPFSVGDSSQLVFPPTQTQRIYGLFYGKLLDQFGDVIPIHKALGFIDYRQIQWHKR